MKNVNINTLENVKVIESKIKPFSSFYACCFFNISTRPQGNSTMAMLWQTSARDLMDFLNLFTFEPDCVKHNAYSRTSKLMLGLH